MGNYGFVQVGANSRCRICGKDSWCSVTEDGSLVVCRRVATGAIRAGLDKNGASYYVHRLGKNAHTPFRKPPKAVVEISLADIDGLHRVYSELLALLPLSDVHRKALHDRGLSDKEIEHRQYRSFPTKGRYELADALVKRFGEPLCSQIPGLAVQRVRNLNIWNMSHTPGPGIFVPSRDILGRIEALKIRRDQCDPGPRYIYFSSRKMGGPGPGARVHVPLHQNRGETIRLTEGELKADIATALSGLLTISIPGVQSWRMAISILKALQARTVRIAFDADANTNINVAKSLRDAMVAFQQEGLGLEVESWN